MDIENIKNNINFVLRLIISCLIITILLFLSIYFWQNFWQNNKVILSHLTKNQSIQEIFIPIYIFQIFVFGRQLLFGSFIKV